MKAVDIIKRANIILAKYDGDNDTMPGLPIVSFTEFQLLEMVKDLATRVHLLEMRELDRELEREA